MKKILGFIVLSLLLSEKAHAIIYTNSGNIDPGLFIIWTLIICGLIWFAWDVWENNRDPYKRDPLGAITSNLERLRHKKKIKKIKTK